MGVKRRATLFVVAAGAVVAGAIIVANFLSERRQDARIDAEIEEIASLISPPEGHQQKFDAIRAFIHDHSVHSPGGQEFRDLRSARAFTTEIVAHAKGLRADPVPMECATRSNVMGQVLRKLGYETRTVAVFDTDTENLRSHSFLDVLNPDTGRWETQDPDFDIHWRHLKTGERASLYEVAEDYRTTVEPCRRGVCSWTKKPNRLHRYLDVLSITDKLAGTRSAIFTTRAKPYRQFHVKKNTGTFCEVMGKYCADGFEPAKPVN